MTEATAAQIVYFEGVFDFIFGVVPMMFVLPYLNRIFLRMTGKIYLGAMVTCLIFVMTLITNTLIYLPLQRARHRFTWRVRISNMSDP